MTGGGKESYNDPVGRNTLVPYILDRGIKELDYIMISHFDTDHIGGIFTVMEELKIGSVIISKQGEQSENLNIFKELVKKKGIKVIVVEQGDIIKIEKNLYIDILWPKKSNLISENILNNNSIVCKLHYNNFSVLFTGDIEEKAERQILQEYSSNLNILNSQILKVAHHGLNTSSTQEFIDAVNPRIALIGVGENNKFGHPNKNVIKRFENMRNRVL